MLLSTVHTIDLAKICYLPDDLRRLDASFGSINSILFLAIYFWRDVQSLPILGSILNGSCCHRSQGGQCQGGSPFGSRGTTSSGVFDISALRPATDLGLERREASAAPKQAQGGEGSEFLGAQPDGNPFFFLDT